MKTYPSASAVPSEEPQRMLEDEITAAMPVDWQNLARRAAHLNDPIIGYRSSWCPDLGYRLEHPLADSYLPLVVQRVEAIAQTLHPDFRMELDHDGDRPCGLILTEGGRSTTIDLKLTKRRLRATPTKEWVPRGDIHLDRGARGIVEELLGPLVSWFCVNGTLPSIDEDRLIDDIFQSAECVYAERYAGGSLRHPWPSDVNGMIARLDRFVASLAEVLSDRDDGSRIGLEEPDGDWPDLRLSAFTPESGHTSFSLTLSSEVITIASNKTRATLLFSPDHPASPAKHIIRLATIGTLDSPN